MTTATESATAAPPTHSDIAHLRCLICFPEWIPGGTFAVCGALFEGDNPPSQERCVVCVDMDEAHFVRHYLRGEMPL